MPSRLLCCFGRRDSLSPQFHAGHQLDASVHPKLQSIASDWASVPVDVLQARLPPQLASDARARRRRRRRRRDPSQTRGPSVPPAAHHAT